MSISEITAAMLLKALDAASLRHQAISSNLANANSVDYRPQRVNFEEEPSAKGPRAGNVRSEG